MLKLILLIAIALAGAFVPDEKPTTPGTVIVANDPQPGCPGPGCKPR